MEITHVHKSTYYFDFGWICIPFYKVNDNEIILIDCGLKREGKLIYDYLIDNHIQLKAVVFSHIHVDHICGIIELYDYFKPGLYGSFLDLEDSVLMHGLNGKISEKAMKTFGDMYTAIPILREHMQSIDESGSIDIDGAGFSFIETHGHTTVHKMVEDPNGVLYIGDALMAHKTLKRAKLPYSQHLKQDLDTKKSLYNLDYQHFIAAHDGDFQKDDLKGIIDANIAIYQRLIDMTGEILKNNPNIDVESAKNMLIKELNIASSSVGPAITHTLTEIFGFFL